MIKDTYQSIPGRGAHLAARKIRKAINSPDVKYAMKLDIKKFYPSVKNKYLLDPKILKIRCKKTMSLIADIVTSLPELPLGNHTSQYFGNLLLTPLDWYCKQELGIKYYYRYCDDILILSDSPANFKKYIKLIQEKLKEVGLSLKEVDPPLDLSKSNVDFLGFLLKKDSIKIRIKILNNFKDACKKKRVESFPSYYGWFKHTKSLNTFHRHVGELKWR